ncbi:MAG TPA: hypothetical protein V6D47_22200 [Oscillatoriaceae cyanobacterium]
MRRFALLSAALLLLTAAPALALDTAFKAPVKGFPLAQQRVSAYLRTIPNLPKHVQVLPATGEVLYPGAAPGKNITAEVWTVIDADDPKAPPLLMFAVRPDTGDVTALFFRSLEKQPKY